MARRRSNSNYCDGMSDSRTSKELIYSPCGNAPVFLHKNNDMLKAIYALRGNAPNSEQQQQGELHFPGLKNGIKSNSGSSEVKVNLNLPWKQKKIFVK